MWIPGFGSEEIQPYKKACTTEAHKQVRSHQSPRAARADPLSHVSYGVHTAAITAVTTSLSQHASLWTNGPRGQRQRGSLGGQSDVSLVIGCSHRRFSGFSLHSDGHSLKLLNLASSNIGGTLWVEHTLPISLMKSSSIVIGLNITCGPVTEDRLRKAEIGCTCGGR